MEDNNLGETINETLKKSRIIYDFTYEEMDKIAREEILRERIREEIQQSRVASNCTKKSPYSGISGIFMDLYFVLLEAFYYPHRYPLSV